MPRYTYISRDPAGQRITATAEAENRQGLLNQLKERGLTVIELKEQKFSHDEKKTKRWSLPRLSLGGVNSGELAVFWREFATMVAAGLPIVEALQSISEELEHSEFRKILQGVTASTWEGFNFSDSLRKYPRVFSPMVVALMGAAEESGSLPQVANQLANFLENRDRLIRKVQAAMTYPIFLSVVFMAAVTAAVFWIVPKFQEIYAGFDAELPWLTEKVFAVNSFILHNLIWITLGIIVAGLTFIFWGRTVKGRRLIDQALLKIPVFGKLLQRAAIARFARSLAVLLSGGIPINRALEMAQGTSGNTVLSDAIRSVREEILQGSKIAAALRRYPVFPKMAVRMVSAGEETGSMSELLEKVADFYESRVDAALTTINALIEPIFVVMIGLFVLVFILSLYLPIFKLAATIK